jgi:hypothetical protein
MRSALSSCSRECPGKYRRASVLATVIRSGPSASFTISSPAANFSFLQDAKVKSWPLMCHQQGWHPRLVHADTHSIAVYARLCDFEYSLANAVSITNTDLVIRKSFDGEILAELSESKITAPKDMVPVLVRLHLVDEYRALLPTVTGEIGLPIAVDVQVAYHPSAYNRKLPDCCSHSLAAPYDFTGKTDIQREQPWHLVSPPPCG